MSFDFQAFMQGFLETRTADIQEKKGEASAYKERMRLMSERNASIAKQRTDMYQSSKTMGDKLLQMGASPDMIQAALKSGQKGLTSLYQTVTNVHAQLNDPEEAKAWLKDEANKNIVHDLGSAQGVGTEGLDALYRETVGLPTGSKIGDYTYEQPDFLGKILGKTDYMEEARSQLDAEQGMYGGFSTYDLATIGRLPDYMPGSQGETFSIVAPKIYTPDAFAEETDKIAEKVKQARSSAEYASALRVFTKADEDFIKADRNAESFNEIERQRTAAKEKMDAVLARSLQVPIRNAAKSYYNETAYLTDMEAELQNTLGFAPDWLLDDIEVSKAADAQLEGEGDTPKDPKTNETGPLVVRTIKDEDGNAFDVVDVDGVERIKLPNGNILTTEASQEILTSVPVEGGDEDEPSLTRMLDGKDGIEKTLTRMQDGKDGIEKTLTRMLDGKDGIEKTLTREEKIAQRRKAGQEGVAATADIAKDAGEAIRDASNYVDKAIGSAYAYHKTPLSKGATVLGAVADASGFKDLADMLFGFSVDVEEGGDELSEKGFGKTIVKSVNELLDKLGVPAYSETEKEATGYIAPTIGATELNLPAFRNAINKPDADIKQIFSELFPVEAVSEGGGTTGEVTADPFENALMAVLEKVDPYTPVTNKQLKAFVTSEIDKSKGVFTLEDTDIIMNAINHKLGM